MSQHRALTHRCRIFLILLQACTTMAHPPALNFLYFTSANEAAQNDLMYRSNNPPIPKGSLDKLTDNSTTISAADVNAILAEISFSDINRDGANSTNKTNAKSTAVGCPMRALSLDRHETDADNNTDSHARRVSKPMQSTSRVNRPSPTTMETAKASATIEAATVQMCRSAVRSSNNTQTATQVLHKLRQIDLAKIDNHDIKHAAAIFTRFHKRQKLGNDDQQDHQSDLVAVESEIHKRPRHVGNESDSEQEDRGEDDNENSLVDGTHGDTDEQLQNAEAKHFRQRKPNGPKPAGNAGRKPGNPSKPPTNSAASTAGNKKICLPTPQFRTTDGSSNNLLRTEWGRPNSLMKRLYNIGPHYDGDCHVKDPRMRAYAFNPATYRNIFADKPTFGKKLLPDARAVTNVLMNAGPNGIHDDSLTNMMWQWGQFIDHDLSLSPLYGALDGTSDLPLSESCVQEGKCLTHSECICICNTGDVGDKACLDLRRSAPGQTSLGEFREQINELTAYFDGSQVYGSSDNETLELRARFPTDVGLLKVSKSKGQEMLPIEADVDSPGRSDGCQPKSAACYVAGDIRVNTHIGLASMQTLWLREHNRIARQLHTINPKWNGERVFQETRRIIVALLQRITYGHWLPIVLGQTVSNAFGLTVREDSSQFECNSYKSSVEVSTLNEFATAAFRFGHSLVENDLKRRGAGGGHIRLSDTYFDMSILKNEPQTGNALLGGFCDGPAQKVDNLVANVIRNELFKMDGFPGHDLPARSIQRGRDHGQPGYAFFAWACQQRYGSLASTFYPNLRTKIDAKTEAFKIGQISLNELPLQPAAARLLQQAGYNGFSAADMDLFPAGISEVPIREMTQGGGLVGPTFACIIAEQFRQFKRGDRFFYTNPAIDSTSQVNRECTGANAFTPCQLRAITRQSLAHVMCANGAVTSGQSIQRDVFRKAAQANPSQKCASLPPLDLSLWKDGAKCNESVSCQ